MNGKMAAKRQLLLYFTVSFFHHVNTSSTKTRVEVTAAINPVEVGGILALQCQIWNMEDGFTVNIVRTSEGEQSVPIYLGNNLQSSMRDRAFMADRTFPGGSRVFFLTILDVAESDRGEYGCMTSSFSGLSLTEIARHSVNIDIISFPDKTQPLCLSYPNNVVLQENDMLELICSSNIGNPPVDLKWKLLSTYEYLPTESRVQGNNVVSNSVLKTEILHNDAVFLCEMSSSGFPDRMRTCQIGPITMLSYPKPKTDSVNRVTIHPNRDDHDNTIDVSKGQILSPEEDCSDTCQSASNVVFYLTISTASASILCIVFLITTIVMVCKYRSVSRDAANRHYNSVTSRVSDPMYVSLQRRQENERVYMTLEDPNNPEGKVLLPKEIFDEFYNRTLSLRIT